MVFLTHAEKIPEVSIFFLIDYGFFRCLQGSILKKVHINVRVYEAYM